MAGTTETVTDGLGNEAELTYNADGSISVIATQESYPLIKEGGQVINDSAIMTRLRLDPARQLIAAQCSGALVLARLGLLGDIPACTDLTSKPWVQDAGVTVLDQPFHATGNIATAGGCLASPYLAAWIIARTEGQAAAKSALHYVAPVGEKDQYVARAWHAIAPYLYERNTLPTPFETPGISSC